MVAQKTKFSRYGESSNKIRQLNLKTIGFLLDSLPRNIKKEVDDINKEAYRTIKRLPKNQKSKISDINFLNKLQNVTTKVLQYYHLPLGFYSFYFNWFLLNHKISEKYYSDQNYTDGPSKNFIVTTSKKSLLVHFFHKPTTYDWRMLKKEINYDFSLTTKTKAMYKVSERKHTLSLMITSKPTTIQWIKIADKINMSFGDKPSTNTRFIDPRTKLKERKIASNKTTYDAIDKIYGNSDLSLDKQKASNVRQLKRREKISRQDMLNPH